MALEKKLGEYILFYHKYNEPLCTVHLVHSTNLEDRTELIESCQYLFRDFIVRLIKYGSKFMKIPPHYNQNKLMKIYIESEGNWSDPEEFMKFYNEYRSVSILRMGNLVS